MVEDTNSQLIIAGQRTRLAKPAIAQASLMDGSITAGGYSGVGRGSYYVGDGIEALLEYVGNSSEKLILPKSYHRIVKMCYDFYLRGGVATTVINRLTELTITHIRNGQRKTGQEANDYYEALLNRSPSRLMRFLRFACLEYFLSGMVLPSVEWKEYKGAEISPSLTATKTYMMPSFDLYPPNLVHVVWTGWGSKDYYLKVPSSDIKLIRNQGSKIKEQQLRYEMWSANYPEFVQQIQEGGNEVLLKVDPIMRKEVTFSAYPTPFLFNALESLLFKQQLRRMDFAVASRVINAILLIQEGNDDYPLTEETQDNLDNLKTQIMARTGNPRLMERLFMLFSNHTTKLTWVSPDVEAMLNQEKYQQNNEELAQALGFAQILLTGESRNAQASELSTWAIQPMMEEARSMFIEWLTTIYEEAAELNNFRNIPTPAFKPIQLQDFVKTAAVFAQAFKEGNISRTTRNEQIGLDFETEQEQMLKEKELIDELNKGTPFGAMPYNVQMPTGGGAFGVLGGRPAGANKGGRPQGSQNVPVNKRNAGVKIPGQKPTSQVAAELIPLMADEDVITLLSKVAEERGIYITPEMLNDENPPENNE